ncbi:MAG: esterase family protein [Lewinellaceae bacterium]|nr:esterase family protein [Lewinellaceae bacterium]
MNSFRTIERSDPAFEMGGLRFLTVKTPNLQGRGDICLFVPKVEKGVTDLPIYILLHGVYGSAWAWAMNGGAHRTTQRLIEHQEIRPAIIAMPSDGMWGDGSAYFSHHQQNFDQWIVNDVPLAIQENIPEAGKNSPMCISGLSMGGYGALMLGARFPEKFSAISAHSSITELEQMALFVEEPLEEYTAHCELPDVIVAMKMNREKLPALRFDCGVADTLIEPNRLLHRQLTELGIRHIFQEFPGGHEWPYWQEHLAKTLRFFDTAVYFKGKS